MEFLIGFSMFTEQMKEEEKWRNLKTTWKMV